jgi:hypothetical protein
MSNTGSLGQGGSFDFNSQVGVMAVLAAVRQSQLTPAQKSELRDLVFLYANGGGDATVRRSLEQKIATYGLTPVVFVKAASAPAPQQSIRPYGNTRPSPQFSPVSIVGQVATPPVAAPAPVVAATPVPVVPPEVMPEPVAVPVVATPPVPPPPPVPEVVPVAPPPVVSASVSAPQVVSTPALDRIREIKTAVNLKVGNPVNLVDIDNTVGREYMMALLEAMKRVSGGAQGDVGQAMVRLEAAYGAVEEAIARHTAAGQTAPAVEQPATPPPPVEVPEPIKEVAPLPEVVVPAPPTEDPLPPPEPVPAPDSRWGNETPAASVGFKAPSLADDTERLLTPQDLPDAASLATSSVAGDPLFTKEVDAGLEQLLAEWTIFKKSGLFGTGPKGREHPLFKTLSNVTIPLILAGRYDGATQEIRQSVTDYMNGWRYEQGIIYEQEETFEHYLRRVIRHIIDLQNRRKGA